MKGIAIIVGVLLISSVYLLAMRFTPGVENQEITVVFRYDDYSNLSPTNFELKLFDLFQRYDIPCTVGIIPYIVRYRYSANNATPQEVIPLSEEKAYILRTAMASGVIEPALHGYSHQDCSISGVGPTEFSGLRYKEQMEKIVKGKELLEDKLDTQITIFIPPWNHYDMYTLQCLETLNFNCISADLDIVPEVNTTLKFLPATSTIRELRQAVESARHSSDPQPVIVVLVHPHDFAEICGDQRVTTHQDFSNLLFWISSQKDIRISSMGRLIKENDFDVLRGQKNKEYYLFIPLIPPFLRPSSGLDGTFLASPYLDTALKFKIISIVVSFSLLVVLSSFIITFFTGIMLFRRFPALGKLCQYFIPVLFIFFLIYVFKNLTISCIGLTILTFIFGMHVGVWRSLIKIKKMEQVKPCSCTPLPRARKIHKV